MSTAIIALMVICCCSSSGTGAMFGLGYVPQTEPHFKRLSGIEDVLELGKKIKKTGKQDDCSKLGKKLGKLLKNNKKYKEDFGGFWTHDFGYVNLDPADGDTTLDEYWEEREYEKVLLNDDGSAVCALDA
jgi:hypothetical protein